MRAKQVPKGTKITGAGTHATKQVTKSIKIAGVGARAAK